MFELFYPEGNIPVVPTPTAKIIHETLNGNEMPQEQLPVVEQSGLVVGRASRSYCHCGSKVLHPVVHIHVITPDERIYLQKRSMSKEIQPGKWDTAVGGHVSYGESIAEALFREASEELGLTDFNPIYIDTYVFESAVDRELVNVFAVIGSGYDIKPDPSEVDEGRFWPFAEVESHLVDGTFTPNFSDEFVKYRNNLLSLI